MIAIDWGTTHLRGALLDERGAVREEREVPRGILSVEPGGFPELFQSVFGDWMAPSGAVALMAGMVGSRQGWQEAPYCACPAGWEEIAGALTWVVPERVAIVPGLSCTEPGVGDPRLAEIPDVMRGEETQVLGALAGEATGAALVVLPGTHSKWVDVRDGRIVRFATAMTGELYQLLRRHSILQRTLPEQDTRDDDAFALGVRVALRGGGLLHTAFSTRTLALFGKLPEAALPDYLSGLVIGEEVRLHAARADRPVLLVGARALTDRYRQALELADVPARVAPPGATWAGLWRLRQHLGAATR